LVISLSFGVPVANAQTSVACVATNPGPNGVLDIVSSGAPGSSDTLTVGATGADYTIVLSSGGVTSQQCAAQVYPDSASGGYPNVEVTGSAVVPTTFLPGNQSGLSFAGQPSAQNSLDFSGLLSGVTVSAAGGTASWASGIDVFSGVTRFVGAASGSNTFLAGTSGGFVFDGGGGSGNRLDFSGLLSGVTVSVPDGTASFAMGVDTFSGFSAFVGAAAGSNTFVAGPGSAAFSASGTNNVLDLSRLNTSSSTPARINLSGSAVAGQPSDTVAFGSSLDSFSGIGSFDGSSSGWTRLIAGPSTVNFRATAANNTLDLSEWNSNTTPVRVNLSGTVLAGQPNDTAAQGSLLDSFSGVDTFIGAATGNTTFAAANTGGLTFNATGTNNTLDLSAAPAGALITLLSPGATAGTVQGLSGTGPGAVDTFSGIELFQGSARFAQIVTFTSTPPANPTVGQSYAVSATASSGLPVTFAIDAASAAGTCSSSGATVTFVGAGTCVIDANQAGNTQYVNAQQQQTIVVANANAACQPGTYSSTGLAPCTAARAGSYVAAAGATAPTPCAPGSYQSVAGQTSCLPAAAGSYVAGTGATASTLCAAGSFQPHEGQVSCVLATAGTYVATAGATSATPCAVGSYQNAVGQTSCTLAPAGTYVSTVGASAATPCAPGTTTSGVGATSSSACHATAASVEALVGELVPDASTAHALVTSLDGADRSAASGNFTAAANQVEAFRNKVNADLDSHKITDATATVLLALADALRAAYQSGLNPN
jgi:hypothetical protein